MRRGRSLPAFSSPRFTASCLPTRAHIFLLFRRLLCAPGNYICPGARIGVSRDVPRRASHPSGKYFPIGITRRRRRLSVSRRSCVICVRRESAFSVQRGREGGSSLTRRNNLSLENLEEHNAAIAAREDRSNLTSASDLLTENTSEIAHRPFHSEAHRGLSYQFLPLLRTAFDGRNFVAVIKMREGNSYYMCASNRIVTGNARIQRSEMYDKNMNALIQFSP